MKKLIEVALPLEAINAESARENYIYRGNPSAIHKWWAQRPLASCRAVLFASLVDDPSEYITDEGKAHEERERLFGIIRELVHWENSNDEDVLDKARLEIARSVARNLGVQPPIGAAAVREFLAEKAPPVLDPFAGGGSIPLEAQRLGLRAYASDLNPVAVLINKALIEIPPKFAGRPPVHPPETMVEGRTVKRQKRGAKAKGVQLPLPTEWKGAAGLAEDVRYYGQWMRNEAEKRIGHLYPKVKLPPEYGGGEATVIAWLWARTVKCPNPACGATMPLVRSFALSTKKGKQAWVEPIIEGHRRESAQMNADIEKISVNQRSSASQVSVSFTVKTGSGTPPEGTVNRRGARCIACGTAVPFDHVRAEGKAGRMGAQLMAIVAEGKGGRVYLPPDDKHAVVAASAKPEWAPETDLPEQALGFRVQLYGMTKHRDLFTSRQLVALTTLGDLVCEVHDRVRQDAIARGMSDNTTTSQAGNTSATAYADAIKTYLAFAVDKCSMYGCSLVPWYAKEDRPSMLFSRQAISMVWDFTEVNPFTDIGGSLLKSVEIVADSIPSIPNAVSGYVSQRDAASEPFPNHIAVSTDPPYYDNVPYADLSDFFYVWLRHSLQQVYPDLFRMLLVPKNDELVADPHRYGGQEQAEEHFVVGIRKTFVQMRKSGQPDYPVTLFYAFKQSETGEDGDESMVHTVSTGWETMLEGLIQTGYAITGTWPMRTERTGRMRDTGSNALASSIVIVCRPRPEDAPLATRRDFLAELKRELPTALRELQQGNIAPVDLAQAAIGPGMAVFSRYRQVLEADSSPMRVRAALALINQAMDEFLTEQEGEYDSDTRWALAWFEQYGQESGPYGVAETLSKAKNTSPEGLVRAGILESRAGQVRLLRREELRADWDPRHDERPTAWEAAQYLIRALDQGGEQAASALLAELGALSENARDLAYRLYTICERKNWAQEALGYNMLVVAWPRLVELAARVTPQQQEMFGR
jgi:putative DNA methylase